jgi:hypothetical protein
MVECSLNVVDGIIDFDFQLMSLLRSPSGHLNDSTIVTRDSTTPLFFTIR